MPRDKVMRVALGREAELSHCGDPRGFLRSQRQYKLNKLIGVTLMEVMLVLAIAALIIVMSVRYYQTTASSQQANAVLLQIESITEIADRLAQGSGSYQNITQSAIALSMPNQLMTSPWGTPITITGGTATYYEVSYTKMPKSVCAQVVPRISANPRFNSTVGSGAPACNAAGTFTYTYNAGL